MSLVVFDRVTLDVGGRTVLSRASFDIGAGAFVGLLGPNGAGKTTLMRAILGLVRPREGRILVSGAPAQPGGGEIGYMPQLRAQTDLRWTGWDLVFGAVDGHRWGLPRHTREAREEVAWALDMVGATAIARRPLGELSGGERQRLLLSQALLGRPKLLLLDEPLISLDPAHQRGTVELASRLRDDLGLAVLFSAHELNPLLNAIDSVLYVGAGRAVLGTIDDVITGPVLSRLYGSPIEVIRAGRRVFVVAADTEGPSPAQDGPHQDNARVRL